MVRATSRRTPKRWRRHAATPNIATPAITAYVPSFGIALTLRMPVV
jgi:hypothetical protein